MADNYSLTDETPTPEIIVKGWESFIFVRGDFGGGRMVTEYSPDGSNWFADNNLTFSFKGFETFRGAPSIRYRFRMSDTSTTPAIVVSVA